MTTTSNNGFMAYLDTNQQDLLSAALVSNNPSANDASSSSTSMQHFSNDGTQLNNFSFDGMDPALFMNHNNLAMSTFNGSLDDSPYLDNFGDNDPNFDFDFDDTNGQMIGDLPGEDNSQSNSQDDDDDEHHDIHDKRKNPDDDDEDNGKSGKRREGESKEAKKPGRKPLTSEPTNKRKAQNRAAQRAFRERKERHLKDLETKVEELEKASESANHENGLLKAQVERLQIELREYRKRLSLNSGLLGRSPPLGNNMFLPGTGSTGSGNFQFDFPRFGNLPGGVFGKTSATKAISPPSTDGSQNNVPGVLARNQSGSGRSISPRSQARLNGSMSNGSSPGQSGSMSSTANTPNQPGTNGNSISSIFTPADMSGMPLGGSDFTNWVTTTTSAEPESTVNGGANPARVFQFNSNSNSTSTASPGSSSSASQYGANSSCGTSPEPSHNSPYNGHLDPISECKTSSQSANGEMSFCEALNQACGNIRNPIPRTKSQSNGAKVPDATNSEKQKSSSNNTSATENNDIPSFKNGFDTMAHQNGGTFDPVLFDTYREPQSAIVGDGDFTGGFFNDAMPTMDFTSSFNWADLTAPTGLTPAAVQKNNPLDLADALTNGIEEDEVVPADEPGALLSCHKIWDKLQDRDDFKNGSLDIDGLCSELRAKARCSESGVVIDQKDVDSALKKIPPKVGGASGGGGGGTAN